MAMARKLAEGKAYLSANFSGNIPRKYDLKNCTNVAPHFLRDPEIPLITNLYSILQNKNSCSKQCTQICVHILSAACIHADTIFVSMYDMIKYSESM